MACGTARGARPTPDCDGTTRYRKFEQRIDPIVSNPAPIRMGTISIVIETYTWLLGVIQFPDPQERWCPGSDVRITLQHALLRTSEPKGH
jgi:hypothetical protein